MKDTIKIFEKKDNGSSHFLFLSIRGDFREFKVKPFIDSNGYDCDLWQSFF